MSSSTSSSDLPDSAQSEVWRKSLLPVLLLLATVGAIEGLAYSFRESANSARSFVPPGQLPNLEESIVQAKINFAAHNTDKIDLVVLGDSSGLMGVDAKLLSEETGLSTYNLCTIGWIGVEGHLILLEEFIAVHGRPSVVVYHFAPDAMRRQSSSVGEVGYLSRLKWVLGLEETGNADLLPSFAFRSITRNAVAPDFGNPDFGNIERGRWPSHLETLRLLDERNGSMLEVNRANWINAPELPGGLSSYQQESIRRLVHLSSVYGFRLYLIANPLPEIARSPANSVAMEELEAAIVATIGNSESAHLYRPLCRFTSNESCATLNHLHPNAVPENTMAIADFVLRSK